MNFEQIIMLCLILFGVVLAVYIIRIDWKTYGLLYLISLIFADSLCYVFTFVGLYSFPNNIFHNGFLIPYGLVSTLFPSIALAAIRFSPEKWLWKIPFYWGIVHLGVLGEVFLKHTTIFKFEQEWDLWDSYTLWWLYYLLLELLGGKIIPEHFRKPLNQEIFRYGRWGWIIFHVIVITTIFLAGVYVGITLF